MQLRHGAHRRLLPVLPLRRVPVDGHGQAAFARPRPREGVKESVRGAVIHLAEDAADRKRRREQREEIERRVFQRALDRERPPHLRGEHRLGHLRSLQLHEPAAMDFGGVQNAVDRPEARDGAGRERPHLLGVGNVSAGDHHLRARRFEGQESLDIPASLLRAGMRRRPIGPGFARGKLHIPREHELGPHGPGEALGERQVDLSEAAGQQVDAAFAQTRRRRRVCGVRLGLE